MQGPAGSIAVSVTDEGMPHGVGPDPRRVRSRRFGPLIQLPVWPPLTTKANQTVSDGVGCDELS